jgi:hypothetical protein
MKRTAQVQVVLRLRMCWAIPLLPPICLNSMHKDIFTFTNSGDYDQAVTNIIVLNVSYSCYFDCLHTSGFGISDEHICDRGEEIAKRILAGNVCIYTTCFSMRKLRSSYHFLSTVPKTTLYKMTQ